MGDGEVDGEVIRGFGTLCTARELVFWLGTEPNWIGFAPIGFPVTGPPFVMNPEVPAALIVTEVLRLWSPGPEIGLIPAVPFAMFGVPTAGTAGGMVPLPFTESDLPCWGTTNPPTPPEEDEEFVVAVGDSCFLETLA